MKIFAQRLKELRIDKKFSQAKFAAIIGVSDTQYQRYEYDQSEPPLTILQTICDTFNVNANYLLGLSDEIKLDSDKDFVFKMTFDSAPD